MSHQRWDWIRFVNKRALAVVAAAALLGGAAWRGLAADPQHTGRQPQAAAAETTTPGLAGHLADGRTSYADIVKMAAPAVVTIRVQGHSRTAPTQFQDDDLFRRFFGDRFDRGEAAPHMPRTFRQRGLGSGVIISHDGLILTNHHVVDEADDVQVELTDGRTFPAKVVGSDKPSDLALVKIAASNLPALPFGNSDAAQVGDVVLAIGNPFGLGQTVTMGIISAKGRSTTAENGSYEDFLQTDAPINHGNSGGALVNTKGELIGINSQIAPVSDVNIGIGFAIPSNMVRQVADDLKNGGRVHRAQLGVVIQPVTSDLAASLELKEAKGVIISSVEPGSAADRAGLKQGDVILTFNGESVGDMNALRNRVAGAHPGSSATVSIIRDGSRRDVAVKLEEAAVSKSAALNGEPAAPDQASLGVSVTPLTAEMASRLGVPKDAHGLVVEEVKPESRAADAGIQPGDVIEQVNRHPVQSVAELRAAVHGFNKPLLMLISREGRSLFVTVKPTA
jgi:Do/DeqQ family serine protease